MGEQSALNEVNEKDKAGKGDDAVSEKLRLSFVNNTDLLTDAKTKSNSTKTNTDKTLESIAQYRAGRYGIVTTEALLDLPNGLANGVKHNWNNPGEFAAKMGTAALFGVGMQVLLPKAGAAKAVVGGLMTYFMVKDAAKPVVNAWQAVTPDDTDMQTIHNAAKDMSNGLGLFTVDMVAGLPVGLAADKLTGMALNATQSGRNFNAWKEDFYNGKTSPIGKASQATEDLTKAVAEKIKGKEKPTTLEDQLRTGQETNRTGLTIEQKMDAIRENMSHDHGLPKSLRDDVDVVADFNKYLDHKRFHKNELPSRIDKLLAGEKAGEASVQPGKIEIKRAVPEVPPEGKAAGDSKAPASTGAGTPLDKPAQTVQQMAVAMRDAASKVTEADMKIANFKESVQSPLTQSMRTELPPPLDKGHWANNRNLIELTDQISTPEHIQQAGMLLEHHRVANVQMGIPSRLPEIVDLNQYSRSVHQDMMNLLRKAGVNPDQALRGTNSPIFLIFDSQGAGPYTIPAIKGVTDTAVIVLPREYQKMLGVHVSGVYRHELGHDLVFGDLLRFPENLRDNVLKKDVIANVMKSKGIADTPVDIPGHGSMPKSELFRNLLLAQANENTADIFAASRDPNSGLSLSVLLSSLRKPAEGAPKGSPGQLETRSVYGTEYASKENPLGIEVHGIDSWRIKLSAEVLKQLSNNDAKVVAYADKMIKMSDQIRRPGDQYIWASADQPGKFVSVPMKEWDAIIPGIVKAQLETPLPALNNNTLRSTYSDMSQIFPKVDSLAEAMANAARKGETAIPAGAFDKSVHRIEDVYSAGLGGWAKALESNPAPGQPGYVKPDVLMARINELSTTMTAQYRGDNFLPPSPGPSGLSPNINAFSMPQLSRYVSNGVVPTISSTANSIASSKIVRGLGWTAKNAIRPEISGPYMGTHFAKELFDEEARLKALRGN